jgi:hypothetical protein
MTRPPNRSTLPCAVADLYYRPSARRQPLRGHNPRSSRVNLLVIVAHRIDHVAIRITDEEPAYVPRLYGVAWRTNAESTTM